MFIEIRESFTVLRNLQTIASVIPLRRQVKKKYRKGAILVRVEPNYILLTLYIKKKNIFWKVSRKYENMFFRKVGFKEQAEIVILEQEQIIESQQKKLEKNKRYILKLKKDLNTLKITYKKEKKQNKKLKKKIKIKK